MKLRKNTKFGTAIILLLCLLISNLQAQSRKRPPPVTKYVTNWNGDTTRIFMDKVRYHGTSIGPRHYGIGFGILKKYNGIKFSWREQDTLTNGLCFSIYPGRFADCLQKRVNGINLNCKTEVCAVNGLNLSFVSGIIRNLNGLNISFWHTKARKVNGINICGRYSAVGFMNGLSINLLGMEDESSVNGVAISGISNTLNSLRGFSISPINSVTDGVGCQIGVWNFQGWAAHSNYGMNGLQLGIFNDGYDVTGVQLGLRNDADPIHGVQLGGWNVCDHGGCIQIGLINKVRKSYPPLTYHALQIGLLNINYTKKRCRVLPFLNF